MRDILEDVDRWRARDEPVAMATVIQTWGSAPRGVGSKMAVSARGEIAGSVSGGCVEAAVVEAAGNVLKAGRPQVLHFGVADETAWGVGLSCGGTLEVFVELLDADLYRALRTAIVAGRPAAMVTVIRGPADLLGRKMLLGDEGTAGSLGRGLDGSAAAAARAALAEVRIRRMELPLEASSDTVEVFVEATVGPPTLVVVGGVHIAVALTTLARTLGYRTVLVDPRPAFGNAQRFPDVDRLVQAWPDEALGRIGLDASTAVAVLTHDPKLDDPALQAALVSPAFYVGALGSKATQARRRQRLLDAGLTEEQIARLHAPIGLDLGGRTPEEIALAVIAQVVAIRNRRPDKTEK